MSSDLLSAAEKLAKCARLELAIRLIESDPKNVIGGLAAWNSGRPTELKPAAANKLQALQKRLDNITDAFEA